MSSAAPREAFREHAFLTAACLGAASNGMLERGRGFSEGNALIAEEERWAANMGRQAGSAHALRRSDEPALR
jgi:hypothetical protein